MRLPEPLPSTPAALRRVLAVGALAAAMALGTSACEEVMPEMETEQGEDGDEGGDQDQGGDQDEGGDEDQDEGGDEDDG
ncbi:MULTISPECIES: DNA primase [Nocardiopsis]|uniref:DNA primase n=1 Tax=Nocardiopsis sinuspersici TaxID=501010 RepID=A0A1V3BZ57_9ACTN|nr:MULTISPECIES: DNA primase [Nocardiopsis]OOC53420.1 DNA primase [Nocardiopsis sinuspersici]